MDAPSEPRSSPPSKSHGPGGFLRTFDLGLKPCEIQASTLIPAKRYDFICMVEFSELTRNLIPGSELRILEDSSLTIGFDEPEVFKDAIFGFIVCSSENGA